MYLDTNNEPFYSEGKNSAPFNNANYPFNNQFYLLLNVASGGNFDSNQLDPTKFCNNAIKKGKSNFSIILPM